MAIGNGTITAMSRDGKRFQIDDGEWYSVFSTAQMNGAMRGASVNFSYVTTPPKGPEGRAYNNVKGNLTVSSSMTEPTPSTGAAAKPSGGGTGGYRGGRSFPVGPLDPERSIIRQNSLAHAVKIAEQVPGGRPDDWEELLVRHLAPAEAQRDLHLVAFLEEALHRAHLHVVVVVVDHRPKFDLLNLDDFLFFASLRRFFLRLEFVLAVIQDLADGGCGIRGDFD